MGKPRSRVAEEARQAQQKSAELQRRIRNLSDKLSNPDKHFTPPPVADERSSSNVDRFRRYFSLDRVGAPVEKRKPTRSEMRAQRNRAIVWIMVAFVALMWLSGKGCARNAHPTAPGSWSNSSR